MRTIEHAADHWTLRTRTLKLGDAPLLMGIVNVTPDSFSDGGRFLDADAAVEHGLRLVAEGANLLDVGGESTRPGSDPVDVQEELRRVMPVLGALCRQAGVPVSIDTRRALIAKHALNAGAEIINDITALGGDPGMLPLAVESGCGVCIMHMQGTPRTMQDEPVYGNVLAEVADYLRKRRDAAVAAGVAQDCIAVDPGIGFGKTTGQNLQLLANAWQLHDLGCPVLVGHSRKRFLTAPIPATRSDVPGVTATSASEQSDNADQEKASRSPRLIAIPTEPADRAAGTIGVALSLARQHVQIIRVHDVAAVRQAMFFFQATGGLD